MIDRFTYTAYGDPSLNWTCHGLALGDPLGPDADGLDVELIPAGPDDWRWGPWRASATARVRSATRRRGWNGKRDESGG